MFLQFTQHLDIFIVVIGGSILLFIISLAYVYVVLSSNRKIFKEQQLRLQTIEKNAALLNDIQEAIIVINLKNQIVFWNKGAELIFGWTTHEVLNGIIDSLPFSISAELYSTIMLDIRQFGEWSGEIRSQNKIKRGILLESHWKYVTNEESGEKEILIVASDVTEKRKTEALYHRALQIENIAILTGGIAHDLQNIFAPIMTSINSIKENSKSSSKKTLITIIENSAQRGLKLVNNILTYGKGISGIYSEISPDVIVHDLIKKHRRTIVNNNIKLKTSFPKRSWKIKADRNQMIQVLMNLYINSCEAMPEGGVLWLKVENKRNNKKLHQYYPEAPFCKYVVFSISDTGVGIPEDQLELIFKPFFTTKKKMKNSGLGLSIVEGIIRNHSGFITVESIVGKGSKFCVHLPALDNKEAMFTNE